MYECMSNTCRKSLRRQFDFSMPELDQMEEFMLENMDKTTKEVLDILMDDDHLNDRQKVIVSYTLGATMGSDDALPNMSKINSIIIENMKIGQGG